MTTRNWLLIAAVLVIVAVIAAAFGRMGDAEAAINESGHYSCGPEHRSNYRVSPPTVASNGYVSYKNKASKLSLTAHGYWVKTRGIDSETNKRYPWKWEPGSSTTIQPNQLVKACVKQWAPNSNTAYEKYWYFLSPVAHRSN